jgi:hypothetical protein
MRNQEPPIIGRLADKTAGSMPSGIDIAMIQEVTDLVEESATAWFGVKIPSELL